MAGVYTAAERVVRDGVLIAYEGEVMTGEEAEARGLIEAAEAGETKDKTPKEKLITEAEAADEGKAE